MDARRALEERGVIARGGWYKSCRRGVAARVPFLYLGECGGETSWQLTLEELERRITRMEQELARLQRLVEQRNRVVPDGSLEAGATVEICAHLLRCTGATDP